MRGPGRRSFYRFGRYLGLTASRLEAASDKEKKGGVIGLGVAILTPGVRSVAITAASVVDLPLLIFLGGLTLGSTLFLALHVSLGYAGQVLRSGVWLPIVLAAALVLLAASSTARSLNARS